MNQARPAPKKIKWITAGLCMLIFLLLAVFLDRMGPIDQAAYHMVSRLAAPLATRFFNACTTLASPVVLLALCFGLVLLVPRKEYRVPLLANLALSVLLNLGLKDLFARARPTEVLALTVETGYSFPSGHTMAAACFYGFLIFLVLRSPWKKSLRYGLTALLATAIVLVGLSRIYLGVHFFSDVLGGLCFSAVYLVLFTTFIDKFFTHEEVHVKKRHRSEGATLFSSFTYAFEGIGAGLRTERNMVVHFAAMALAVVFGAVLGLSRVEWMVCLILFGLVFMAELLNTAVETIVDMITTEFDPRAKLAKDTAAGAVLVISIAAAISGALIFVPKILVVVRSGMLSHS